MFHIRPIARAARLCAVSSLLALGGHAHAAIHALLIGITDYKDAKISDLQGPANDIALMKDVLINRFEVPASNIKSLPNGTHTQIKDAFEDLTKRIKKGDYVYIHYSGHGSSYKSPDPSEKDGQDETWVTYGARTEKAQGDDKHDILDKELGTWMMKLYEKTDDVVLVSDSCHSASVTRDVQVGARSVDKEDKPHPLRAIFNKEIVYPETAGLRIGAARDTESAVELDSETNKRCFGPQRCYGVFTWHWAQALLSSRPKESWGDVYDRALAAIEANPQVVQRPQKSGAADRYVFGGGGAPLTFTVAVRDVNDRTVQLGAGRLSGLTKDTELVGVGPAGAPVPRLKVTSVAAATATATLLEGEVKKGGQLKVSKYQAVEPPITLHVGGPQAAGVDAETASRVKTAISQAIGKTLQNFELVDKPEDAQWRLELVRPRSAEAAKEASRPEHVQCAQQPCTGTELWVVNSFGQVMHPKMRFPMSGSDQKLSEELARLVGNLDTFSRAKEVRAIAAGQNNDMPLQLMVSVWRPPEGSKDICKVGAGGAAGWKQVVVDKALTKLVDGDIQPNDCLSFTVVNTDENKPWYGYVLSVDPNFGVNLVWPNVRMSEDDARVPAKNALPVKHSYYRLNTLGRETLIFIASDKQTPLRGLAEAGMRGTGGSSLGRLMRRAPLLTRGGTEISEKESVWGAQSVSLEVGVKKN